MSTFKFDIMLNGRFVCTLRYKFNMEKDKILKVLEEVSSGTKLYSTTFGKLEFNGMVASTDGPKIELATKNQECITYFPDGRYRKENPILFNIYYCYTYRNDCDY